MKRIWKGTNLLILVSAFLILAAGTSFAAQRSVTVSNETYYTATSKYFFDDGKTNYPYEIYLPNEKEPAKYRIHSNYSKNTDACASCHATHTAVGPSLLQWFSVYEACMACHDGTVTTTYNVEDGNIGTTTNPPYGGHFGVGTEESLSSHNVTTAVTTAAAPGGSVVKEQIFKDNGQSYDMWTATFGCESCHTPHGQGGNARILHPDPNGWATRTAKGQYEVDASTGAVYKLDADNNKVKVTLLKGYPYKIIVAGKDNADITDKFNIYNFGDETVGSYTYFVAKDASKTVNDIAYVKGTAAITVRMAISDYLGENEKVKHISGLNDFCGACHVDYNTQSDVAQGNGQDEIMADETKRPGYGARTGTYSQAHRHAVGVKWNYGDAANKDYIGWDNKLLATMGTGEEGADGTPQEGGSYISCLTCHFAHGASKDIWERWIAKYPKLVDDGWGTTLPLKEVAGSSALKRLPNMATCEACHQKGDASQGYLANTNFNTTGQAGTGDGLFTTNNAYYVDENDSAYDCTQAGCHFQTENGQKVYGINNPANHITVKEGVTVKCQSCHGAASNHFKSPSALNIINPSRLGFTDSIYKVCAQSGCHDNTDTYKVTERWEMSKHFRYSNTSCITCHESHTGSSKELKYGSAKKVCSTCHLGNAYTSLNYVLSKINADGSIVDNTVDGYTYKQDHSFIFGDNQDETTNKAMLGELGDKWKVANSKLHPDRRVAAIDLPNSHQDHRDYYSSIVLSGCYNGGYGSCHAGGLETDAIGNQEPRRWAYESFMQSVHFSKAGQTEGIDGPNGNIIAQEPKGMRNRYSDDDAAVMGNNWLGIYRNPLNPSLSGTEGCARCHISGAWKPELEEDDIKKPADYTPGETPWEGTGRSSFEIAGLTWEIFDPFSGGKTDSNKKANSIECLICHASTFKPPGVEPNKIKDYNATSEYDKRSLFNAAIRKATWLVAPYSEYFWSDIKSYNPVTQQEDPIYIAPVIQRGPDYRATPETKEALVSIFKTPPNEACLRCHSSLGEACGKRGMFMKSEIGPEGYEVYDVHAQLSCLDCHKTERDLVNAGKLPPNPLANSHKFALGMSPDIWARDIRVSDFGLEYTDRANHPSECNNPECHGDKPHKEKIINDHYAAPDSPLGDGKPSGKVDCRACHIPYQQGEKAKDYSRITGINPATGLYEVYSEQRIEGDIVNGITSMLKEPPVFKWFNGLSNATKTGPSDNANRFDSKSKITPFTVDTITQIIDNEGNPIPLNLKVLFEEGNVYKAASRDGGVPDDTEVEANMKYEPYTGTEGTPRKIEKKVYYLMGHGVRTDRMKEFKQRCSMCHNQNSVINFTDLGYTEKEAEYLKEVLFSKE